MFLLQYTTIFHLLQINYHIILIILKDSMNYARALSFLSINYEYNGAYGKAEELLIESCALLEKVYEPEPYFLSKGYNNLANFYNNVGRFDEAEYYFKKSIEAIKKNSDYLVRRRGDYWNRLFNLGLLYINEERYDEAEQILNEALDLTQKIDDNSKAMTIFLLASISAEKTITLEQFLCIMKH